MKPCYFCGLKSVTESHGVPVCKDHAPEDPPTERRIGAVEPAGEDWPYGPYDSVLTDMPNGDWTVATVFDGPNVPFKAIWDENLSDADLERLRNYVQYRFGL